MLVSSISPGNIALEYIERRVADNNYSYSPPLPLCPHTRKDTIGLLLLLDEYAPNGSLLTIRNTDISKRPANTPEEADYAKFCDEAKIITGIGTQDAMRKNLFVDFHRMGFINRYNRNGDEVEPLVHSNIRYVSLSKQGLKLINAKDLEEQFFIFSKGVDATLGGHINLLLEIFRNTEYKINNISTYEYMFFVSAVHSNTAFSITIQQCADFIRAYRALARGQQKGVIDILKDKMQPRNYTGNKIDKRDFHNWWNKAEQLFSVITQTVYFKQRYGKLVSRDCVM